MESAIPESCDTQSFTIRVVRAGGTSKVRAGYRNRQELSVRKNYVSRDVFERLCGFGIVLPGEVKASLSIIRLTKPGGPKRTSDIIACKFYAARRACQSELTLQIVTSFRTEMCPRPLIGR